MGMYEADENGFTFHTGFKKALAKQLMENNKLEVIFHRMDNPDNPADLGTVLRIKGEVEVLDDNALIARILEDRPFLKEIASEDNPLFVFRISKGEAFFWTMENNTREDEIERIAFG